MAKKHTVTVTFDFETGDTTVETDGYSGQECYKDTAELEAKLGKAIDVKPKGESYKGKQYEVMRRI
jgi:hypothetical protein